MSFADGLSMLGLFAFENDDDPDAAAAKQLLAKTILTFLDWLESHQKG